MANWDQSKFDALVERHLKEHSSDTWPLLCNRRMFAVTLKSFRNTPVVTKGDIDIELMRQVAVKRPNNGIGLVSVGYAIAARRAKKTYYGSRQFQKQAGRELNRASGGRAKAPDYRAAWLAHVKEVYRSMFGGRAASTGFLRAGFVSILYKLGPIVGYGRPSTRDSKVRGAVKGTILHLAKPGEYSITIENRAHSKSEHLGGFERIGNSALQEAFDEESAELAKHLGVAMEPATQKFNQQA